jgi:uncharacterized phage protein (TIGR01671 family)
MSNHNFKFRVWDKIEKWFTNDPDLIISNGTVFGEQCDIQFSTGLKDVDGKEIYEGDVVEFYFFRNNQEQEERTIAHVEYLSDSAEFVMKIKGKVGRGWSFSMLMAFANIYTQDWDAADRISKLKLKVIGNVFEQPELLNN